MGPFELINDGPANPRVRVRTEGRVPYTVFDLSERASAGGRCLPYTMPDYAANVAVMRVVVRGGFSYDLADDLIGALQAATEYLTANPPREAAAPGFSHT